MRLRTLTATVLLPLGMLSTVAAAPDSATDCRDVDGANVCRVQTYLVCDGTGPVHAYAVDGMAEWSYDPPAAASTEGGGCGEYDETYFGNTTQDGLYSFDMGGIVQGNLDTMTVSLYNLDIGSGRAQDVTLDTRITINGKSVFGGETVTNVAGEPNESPYSLPIVVTPAPTSTQAATVYTFTVTGLGDMVDTLSNPDKNHFVIITIDVSTDNAVVNEQSPPDYVGFNPWVWGASDAPSGAVFNPIDGDELGTVVEAKDYAA